MYDGLTGRYTFGARPRARLAYACRDSARSTASRGVAPGRLPRALRVSVRRGARRPREPRRARLGAAGRSRGRVPQPDDGPPRAGGRRAARARGGTHRSGEWPWSFFYYPEGRPRPVFPSAFRLLAAAEARVGVAVRCPDCAAGRPNVVTHRHVDEPFFNDPDIGVVEHVFRADADALVDAFRAELDSGSFDARRLSL